MKVSVFGLGYVGCISAACLAQEGHSVIGIDVNHRKVNQIMDGLSPIIEPNFDRLIKRVVDSGQLQVTLDSSAAVHNSDLSLVCVGTPSNRNGSLDLQYVENVCREIGIALAEKNDYHHVVIRSTVLPGTIQERIIPLLEKYSELRAGPDFGVCMNPEFLREGSAIKDFYDPGFIVIGALDRHSADTVQNLYGTIEAKVIHTSIQTAEMVKYVSNAFHAAKVVFANEIGNICKAQNIDGQEVMEIFCEDQRLNISTAYLKPGFAFGGSCLPKDLRALLYRAKEDDLETPLLGSILSSNQKHIDLGTELVENKERKRIGVLGLSFKADTDDVRESPVVSLVETLIGRGNQLMIYDGNVQLSRLVGANKSFLEQELPHIASLMCDSIEKLVAQSEVLIITNNSKEFRRIPGLMHEDQVLIDFNGVAKNDGIPQDKYEGICW